MKLIKAQADTDIKLIPLGDLHIGSKECDLDKIARIVDWIKKEKNARVILMGDLIDAGLKDSVGGGAFDNDTTPEEQIDYILSLLEPIKNKIWCTLNGNHEERIRQRTSIDVMKLIAKQLNIPYGNESCFIKAKVGDVNYVIFATHGSTGSLTPNGKLSSVLRLGNFIDADIYLHGHSHELMNHTSEYFRVDIGDKMIIKDKRHYVITGHFLKYGGYAEQKNLSPGKTGVAKILLDKSKKDVHISI